MAGHSKFKNIMHRKGAQDKKRAKLFNKLGREITVAVRITGNPDPDTNPRLRLAIITARGSNMPNSRIQSAIESGDPNSGDVSNYEEVRYEGYGPGGAAIIVEALTDNRNRTASDVRAGFAKNGGSLGETNSVSFMFEHIGLMTYPITTADADKMFEAALEAGADNVETVDEVYEISTEMENFMAVKDALEKILETEVQSANLIWKPSNTITLDEQQAQTMLSLIDALEDSDDVQTVFSNFDIDDAVMEKLATA